MTATALTECVSPSSRTVPNHIAGHFSRRWQHILQDQRRGVAFKRYLQTSVAPLGLLAFLASGSIDAGMAQTAPQAGNRPDNWGRSSCRRRSKSRCVEPIREHNEAGLLRVLRVALVRKRPWPFQLQPADGQPKLRSIRMSLPKSARDSALQHAQTPATVEVIDKQVIEDRGFRTTTDIAKAATGVTGGDAPGAPAIFSMRGFAGDQINTLYNDIWIGPSTMTGRPMDTANLERVEILKGPASLLSGIGATGGAVNYVTKAPHTGPIVNEAFAGSIRSRATEPGMAPAAAPRSTG